MRGPYDDPPRVEPAWARQDDGPQDELERLANQIADLCFQADAATTGGFAPIGSGRTLLFVARDLLEQAESIVRVVAAQAGRPGFETVRRQTEVDDA